MGCKVTIHKSLFVPLYRCRLSVAQIRFVQGKVGNRSQCKSHRLWDSVAPTALHLGERLIPSAMRWADNIARLQHLHYILYQDNMVSIHPNYLFSFHVTPSFVSFTSKPSLANSSRMRSLVDQSLSALAWRVDRAPYLPPCHKRLRGHHYWRFSRFSVRAGRRRKGASCLSAPASRRR